MLNAYSDIQGHLLPQAAGAGLLTADGLRPHNLCLNARHVRALCSAPFPPE